MFKLAIGDSVQVPVRAKINDGGAERLFEFRLHCKRLTGDELNKRVQSMSTTTADIIREVATGWEGQALVLTDDGKPAPFSREALDCMLGLASMPLLLLNAYSKECGAREKKLTQAARLMACGLLRIPLADEAECEEEGEVKAALAAFGLTSGSGLDLEEVYELWPENLESFNLWLALQTQWVVTPGRGATGLNYPGVKVCMQMRGLRGKKMDRLFADVQRMEVAALTAWKEQRERIGGG